MKRHESWTNIHKSQAQEQEIVFEANSRKLPHRAERNEARNQTAKGINHIIDTVSLGNGHEKIWPNLQIQNMIEKRVYKK
jgi:hypothetical protein